MSFKLTVIKQNMFLFDAFSFCHSLSQPGKVITLFTVCLFGFFFFLFVKYFTAIDGWTVMNKKCCFTLSVKGEEDVEGTGNVSVVHHPLQPSYILF